MNNRNVSLDIIKGICIILVIFVHCFNTSYLPNTINYLIECIFLNSFFIVSGYLYGIKKEKNNLKNKFYSLIKPYCWFSFFALLWHVFLIIINCKYVSDTYFGLNLIVRDFVCFISGIGIGTLWFLPVLFVSYSLLHIFYKNIQNQNISIIFFVISTLFLIFSFYLNKNVLPIKFGILQTIFDKYKLTLIRVLSGTSYSIIGFYIYDSITNKNILKKILCMVIMMILLFILFDYKCAFEPAIVILFNYIFINLFKNSNGNNLIKKFFMFMGENSLSVMIIHYLFLLPIEQYILSNFVDLNLLINSFVLFVINTVTTCLMIILLNKSSTYNYMLGKKCVKKECSL